jgi:hypothetical protein
LKEPTINNRQIRNQLLVVEEENKMKCPPKTQLMGQAVAQLQDNQGLRMQQQDL